MTAGAGPRRPRGTARFGTFDAERFWRPASLARLPSLAGAGAHSVVAGLDETLAAACRPDDLLVTRGHVRDGLHRQFVERGGRVLAPVDVVGVQIG
ncbi:hypothetical protein ACWC5G_23960, partial [Streptomyces sp. NPDC001274]